MRQDLAAWVVVGSHSYHQILARLKCLIEINYTSRPWHYTRPLHEQKQWERHPRGLHFCWTSTAAFATYMAMVRLCASAIMRTLELSRPPAAAALSLRQPRVHDWDALSKEQGTKIPSER